MYWARTALDGYSLAHESALELTLKTLLARRGAKNAFLADYEPPYSSVSVEYQKEGALFAARAGRSLIGDEMGLGKTIQAIAAAEIMARHLDVERVLIVCPTSLKHQWEREIAKFAKRSARVVSRLAAGARRGLPRHALWKDTVKSPMTWRCSTRQRGLRQRPFVAHSERPMDIRGRLRVHRVPPIERAGGDV